MRGIRGDDLGKLDLARNNIKQGTIAGFDASEGVAIGTRMAENLGLVLGDTITLVSPDGDVTPMGTTPRVKAYPVVAIYEVGMSEYDSSIIFMPLPEAQLYFNHGRTGSQSIEIFVDNPDDVDALRAPIEEASQRQIYLTDWRQRNHTFFSALEVERNVMFMILTLIVLVAALNIISGLIMLVKDKGRDIAILRTMGATRGAVLRIFLMTGAAIGVTGTHRRRRARRRDLPQRRIDPPVLLLAVGHGDLQSRALFPVAAAGQDGYERDHLGGADGAGAVVHRHAVSGLARRQARSRRSPEV